MLRWVFCMQIRFNSLALCRLNNFACFSVFYSNRNEKNISHNSDLVRESFFVLTDDPIFFRRRQWKLLLGSSLACVRTFRKQEVLKTLNFKAHKQLSVIECGIIIAKTSQTFKSEASCSPENVFVNKTSPKTVEVRNRLQAFTRLVLLMIQWPHLQLHLKIK